MVKVERTITEARKMLNVPFCHYGRTTLGLDCLGLLWIVYTRCGLRNLPRTDAPYGPYWWLNSSQEERLLNSLINIAGFEITEEPVVGCLVTFRLYKRKVPINHCGILVSEDSFIHAKAGRSRLAKVSIDNLKPGYIKRFAHYLKHGDIDYGRSDDYGANSR